MAVITLDLDKNTVAILVEKTDIIREEANNEITTYRAEDCQPCKVFVNSEIPLCMIRGERS